MPLTFIDGDITTIPVDVIVNAADSFSLENIGVHGPALSAAGSQELQRAYSPNKGSWVGKAIITEAWSYPSQYIIHTVGPVWRVGTHNEEQLLYDCYTNALFLALQYRCGSIAFPLISSGTHGFSQEKVLQVGVTAVTDFLKEHEMVVFVVGDKDSFMLNKQGYKNIALYINEHSIEEKINLESGNIYTDIEMLVCNESVEHPKYLLSEKRKLEDVVRDREESFSQMLFKYIDRKGLTDVQVYKRANIDRKLFSKIRSDKNYHPSKTTAIAFAVALELNLDETQDLLGRAGYTLSRSYAFDLIIEYFITSENYNIFEINEALFAFDQLQLGA